MALDFTLLKEDQIWGDDDGNGQLDMMKKYGTAVAPTDLTVILGGWMTGGGDRTSEDDLTCRSWSASSDGTGDVHCVYYRGDEDWYNADRRTISVRPALAPSEASKISPSEARSVAGVRIVEYGEYPQTVADDVTRAKLERLYDSKSLHPTGKNYTFDSVDLGDGNIPFRAKNYPEYELDGKKYVRIPGRPADGDSKLSTGEFAEAKKHYWVEVQPIEWLMDPSGTMVAKKCLFAGIQFDTNKKYDGDFSKTFMKKYLDTYFAKEIEPSKVIDREMLKGLSEKLAEISDLEKLKTIVTLARTPERTEALARIMRVRKAKALLSAAAQKAHKEGDKKTLQEIVEMAKPYAAREAAVLNKFHLRRAERRAARAKKDRE